MRRFRAPTISLIAVVLGAAISSSDAYAGWRSADRRALEDEEMVTEEPYQDEVGDHPPMLYRDYRDEPQRQPPAGAATQPYWGTMQPYWGATRPYWNAARPPGVIQQPGLRTAPLKVQRTR